MNLKDITDQKYVTSYNIDCSDHCKMHLVQEEIFYLGNLNVLTIGSQECCYYSLKLNYPNDVKNYAYSLEDNEIVFGDLSQIENILNELSEDEYRTVVLQTCVPSIMNLDLESLIDSYNDKIILMKIPDYSGINSSDCLKVLYVQLFKNLEISNNDIIDDKEEVWSRFEAYSYEEIISKLKHKRHRVYSPLYLDLINELSSKYDYEIDNLSVFSYSKLNTLLDENEIYKTIYENFIKKLKSQDNILLNTSFNPEILCILNSNNIYPNYMTLPYINEFKKSLMDSLSSNPEIIKDKDLNSFINDQEDIFVVKNNENEEFGEDIYSNLMSIMKGNI